MITLRTNIPNQPPSVDSLASVISLLNRLSPPTEHWQVCMDATNSQLITLTHPNEAHQPGIEFAFAHWLCASNPGWEIVSSPPREGGQQFKVDVEMVIELPEPASQELRDSVTLEVPTEGIQVFMGGVFIPGARVVDYHTGEYTELVNDDADDGPETSGEPVLPAAKEPLHVYDWLEMPSTSAGEADAKAWLDKFTKPAYEKMTNGIDQWLSDRRLTVEWKGKRYRCTGASRLGDVWLQNAGSSAFYDHRVDVEELSNWECVTTGTQKKTS